VPLGQSSGPPASSKQLTQLLALLQDAGYDGYRDARGPLHLTQRQGNGKFTRDEADSLIEQLEADAEAADTTDAAGSGPTAASRATTSSATPRLTAAERALRDVPDALLAAELQRRGWIVVEP
jgi:hypothetical protein